MARLPQPGGDDGNWGTVLNDFLTQVHTPTGLLKDNTITAATIQPGAITTTALADGAITPAKLNPTLTTTLAGKVDSSLIGQANGIARLDPTGKVPTAQLPTANGGTPPLATPTTQGTIQLSGDLGGSATTPRVLSLNGVTITGTPTPGHLLTASSATTASWTTGSLSSASGIVWNTTTEPLRDCQ